MRPRGALGCRSPPHSCSKTKARPAQEKAAERQEASLGLTKFSPADLTATVEDPVFHHYLHMCAKLEEVPTDMVQALELCPCHRPLFDHERVSQHVRGNILESHYGPGNRTCPMAGKNFPELIAGVLDEVLTQMWESKESSLQAAALPANARHITQQGIAFVSREFRRGQ